MAIFQQAASIRKREQRAMTGPEPLDPVSSDRIPRGSLAARSVLRARRGALRARKPEPPEVARDGICCPDDSDGRVVLLEEPCWH